MDRTLAGSPAQQVAQLEQWRRESELEVKQLRQSVSGLTEKNQTLQTQFANAQRQMQLQTQHLKMGRSLSEKMLRSMMNLASLKYWKMKNAGLIMIKLI